MNILYLFDGSADLKREISISLKKLKPGRLFVSPLTIDEERRGSIVQNLLGAIPDLRMEILDFSAAFNKRALSERDVYVKFISDFADSKISPTENVKEYFAFPFKRFSLWWFSLVAEKNTSKSDSYHRLIRFLTILDIQKRYNCGQIWLDISDRAIVTLVKRYFRISATKIFDLRRHNLMTKGFLLPLSAFVRGLAHLMRLILKAAFIKMAMRGIEGRRGSIRESDFLLITYFPLIDKGKLKANKFIDKYFEPLQLAFEEDGKKFSWLAFIGDYTEYNFKEIVNMGKLINKNNHCLFFCEEWFRFRDIFTVFLVYIYIAMKYILKESRLLRNFKYPYIGVNLWPLFRDDWVNSFVGSYLMSGLTYYIIFKNVSQALRQNSTILYPAEMHAWEKALNIASQEATGLRTVGVQHSIVPALLLNYFNDKNDLVSGDNILKMPRPNYLGCTGRITLQVFKDMGWPEEEVFLLGPLRFQHLKMSFRHRIKWQDRENILIVALPILPSESMEILQYVYYAFKDHCDYKILIKRHPACSLKKVIGRLEFSLNGTKFHTTESPLNEILPSAKVSIITESSSALEAFAYECPVIIPKLVNVIDKSPLTGVSDLGIYADNPADLRKHTDNIMESKNNPIPSEEYDNFIRKYFEFQNSNQDFLTQLKCLK